MHRVFVAWDVEEAHRFVRFLQSHGIRGKLIEDREFPSRGEPPDTEGAPEVWISDPSLLQRALELASGFESKPKPVPEADEPPG